MTRTSIIFLMISIFMLIPLMLGEFARNRTKNTVEDFFLQGRNMGLLPLYATAFATWMSAFAFVGAISYFKERGAVYMTTVGWDALFAVLFFILGRRIWHYGKTHGYVTGSDFFRDIYGSRFLTNLVTIISVAFTIFYIDIQMMGGMLLIQTATGGRISWEVNAALFFVVLIVYLWAGGLRAVAMADMFYGLLIIITIMASGLVLIQVAGGPEQVFSHLIAEDPASISLQGKTYREDVMIWLSMFLLVPIGLFMGPQFWIRNYAASSRKHFDVLPFLLVATSVVFIGTMFAGSAVIVLQAQEPGGEELLADTLIDYTPPLFASFIFIGIAAAIFSTANSQIHAVATVYTEDIHRQLFPNMPEGRLLNVAKWAVIGGSALAFLLLFIVPHSLFDMAMFGCAGTAQLIIPVVGALFWARSSARGAAGGILAGLISFFLMLLLLPLDVSICACISLAVNAAVFICWSALTKTDTKTANKIRAYRREFWVAEQRQVKKTSG